MASMFRSDGAILTWFNPLVVCLNVLILSNCCPVYFCNKGQPLHSERKMFRSLSLSVVPGQPSPLPEEDEAFTVTGKLQEALENLNRSEIRWGVSRRNMHGCRSLSHVHAQASQSVCLWRHSPGGECWLSALM